MATSTNYPFDGGAIGNSGNVDKRDIKTLTLYHYKPDSSTPTGETYNPVGEEDRSVSFGNLKIQYNGSDVGEYDPLSPTKRINIVESKKSVLIYNTSNTADITKIIQDGNRPILVLTAQYGVDYFPLTASASSPSGTTYYFEKTHATQTLVTTDGRYISSSNNQWESYYHEYSPKTIISTSENTIQQDKDRIYNSVKKTLDMGLSPVIEYKQTVNGLQVSRYLPLIYITSDTDTTNYIFQSSFEPADGSAVEIWLERYRDYSTTVQVSDRYLNVGSGDGYVKTSYLTGPFWFNQVDYQSLWDSWLATGTSDSDTPKCNGVVMSVNYNNTVAHGMFNIAKPFGAQRTEDYSCLECGFTIVFEKLVSENWCHLPLDLKDDEELNAAIDLEVVNTSATTRNLWVRVAQAKYENNIKDVKMVYPSYLKPTLIPEDGVMVTNDIVTCPPNSSKHILITVANGYYDVTLCNREASPTARKSI